MTPELFKQTEAMMRDAQEMRAFYESIGVESETIERAIAAEHQGQPSPEPRGRCSAEEKLTGLEYRGLRRRAQLTSMAPISPRGWRD